jgi:hypothetical protein
VAKEYSKFHGGLGRFLSQSNLSDRFITTKGILSLTVV